MKTQIKTIAALSLLLFSFFTNGNTKPKTPTCLTISGKVLNQSNKNIEKLTVYLIKENTIIDSQKVRPNNVFSFQLEKNQEYSIKVTQKGYANRLISVSTWLPKKYKKNTLFEFHFDLIPYKSENLQGADAIDFPVALIYYDTKKSCFDYNRKYTSYIKKEYKQAVFSDTE